MQNPQAPFSDAYLAGMSSKRRKLITTNKTNVTDPSAVLTEGVRQVLQSRNSAVGGATAPVTVEQALAIVPHITEPSGSYEQAIRLHMQNRVQSDPDFNAEHFPNTMKFVNKKK